MTRRIATLFVFVAALLVVSVPAVEAQTTVDSNSVTVRNSAPQNVWFTFPTTTNVREVQLGCSNSPVNHNYVFIYEEQPNGFIATYPFQVEVDCNEAGVNTFTGSLKNDIVVNTPDHTVTIKQSTAWTAAYVSCGRSGYCWRETGGSSQIVVQ